jgi:hypothetical protein
MLYSALSDESISSLAGGGDDGGKYEIRHGNLVSRNERWAGGINNSVETPSIWWYEKKAFSKLLLFPWNEIQK